MGNTHLAVNYKQTRGQSPSHSPSPSHSKQHEDDSESKDVITRAANCTHAALKQPSAYPFLQDAGHGLAGSAQVPTGQDHVRAMEGKGLGRLKPCGEKKKSTLETTLVSMSGDSRQH